MDATHSSLELIVFGITSLRREPADARELLRRDRARWGIENGLHGRRDGTPREDAGRIRQSAAAQVLVIVRNAAIDLSRRWRKTSLTAAIRHDIGHSEKSIEALPTPI